MEIIRLGISPMLGTGGLFLSLLGLRPGLFRWKMSHRSHSHRLFWHTEIYMSHGNIYVTRKFLRPFGSKKVPSARAALRMRSENFCDFRVDQVTVL